MQKCKQREEEIMKTKTNKKLIKETNVKEDYSDTYPKGFFELRGSLKDYDIEEPEDLPLDQEDIEV